MVQVRIATSNNTNLNTTKFRKREIIMLSVKSSMSSWMHKFKLNLRKAAAEVLSDSSDSEYGKSTVEAFFDGDTEVPVERASEVEADGEENSHATTLTCTLRSDREAAIGAAASTDPDRPLSFTFLNFDPSVACDVSRSQSDEPFIDGPTIWKARRQLWTAKTEQNTIKEASEHRANFQKIRPQYYTRIYRKLVIEGKSLSQPVNLQDVMKILDCGWIETNKWERAAKGLG
ncbi:Gag1p Ecym_3246 [Eremothecium cymbalariae DBVPG|uniref:Gag1-like clamp domain-containing protein n=1 Tax=Eremothecium cymbalariae (strain CBS 270.75 / DBVPG 7215 / KCTC 17166 / NRRL Y-17582) TaxID=931890 RepID=G8JRH0_ERECY|nr:Hypothetical protein Ecym_3246 [Eremothecium cymbalariae DBVPG\